MTKLLKAILAGCVSWLALTAHAHADPIFTPLTYLLFAGPLGAVLGPAAIYAGLQVAAYSAVLGAQLALSQQQTPKIDPGELKNTFQESETSEYQGVGRVRVGGLKAFGNTKGSFISRLMWHLKGPIDAVEEYFVGGRSVTVDPDGSVSSPPWARASGTYLTIKSKFGDGSETAWPELISDFPDLWTPAHRCRGIFQSLMRFRVPSLNNESSQKLFQKLYQGGAPDGMATARVGPLYDPRDPSQDPDDWTTWKWKDNGILGAAHIMRSYPDLHSSDFDWDFIAAEADRADQLIATLNGSEPRSRCWGIWPSESKRGEVMQQVLDSTGTEVVMSDEGLIRIRLIDDVPLSEITFRSKHITELNWKSGPEAVERPNLCRIKYYSPERGYDMGEINLATAPWARVQEEINRYGEKVFDIELPFCPSSSQAQRIGRRLFLQARADAGSIRTNMAGLAAWGRVYGTIEDEDAEEMMLSRLASPRVDDAAGQVDIPYVVWPQALIDQPWDPPTMEAPPPEPAPDLQYETDIPTPAVPDGWAQVQYPNGTWEARIRFPDAPGADEAEANYRYYPGPNPTQWAAMEEYQGGPNFYAWVTANLNGIKAEFRARYADGDEVGYFSDPLVVDPMGVDNTPTGAPSTNVDVQIGDPTAVATWSITVPELRAVKLTVEYNSGGLGGGSWQTLATLNDVRPAVTRQVQGNFQRPSGSGSTTVDWRVASYTSNGTIGTYATGSFQLPGTG
ncbi:phage tail protein [Chelativorans sp. AA-79]|uniref:phage tail protein n=1 Tax=Chelativorans sp. AA-79 TaxID=3028735 RepID=UPI0023F6E3E8|nr:phage tail protein [Chelativorans sp. AA-79]WEX10271.1 phage tail protein [Chelativorans sp. AA-79]